MALREDRSIIARLGFAQPTRGERLANRPSALVRRPTRDPQGMLRPRARMAGNLPDMDREHLVADDLRKLLKGKDARVAVGVTETGMTPRAQAASW